MNIQERQFARKVELCAAGIDIAGQRLEPDDTKAYVEFRLSHAFPSVTAYGTALHPGTIANSYASLQHQVFNRSHLMRAYDKSPDKKEIPRDHILGSIVGVEFARTPHSGWRVDPTWNADTAPGLRVAAVIHKQAEGVPRLLGEHQAGRHRWTVSQEVNYSLDDSGFLIGEADGLPRRAADLVQRTTPPEFQALNLGYVPRAEMPEDLWNCWDMAGNRVGSNWHGHPVVMLKGGLNGRVHFQGVGLVRYGAEREAQIAQLLATDPNRIETDADGEWMDGVLRYFQTLGS